MQPSWLLVALLALAGLSIVAYAVRALDLPGAVASFFLGLEVALLGGLGWLGLMTLFPVLGVGATALGRRRKQARRVAEAQDGERGVANVLGNGLAAGLAALALLVPAVPDQVAALAFTAAVAAATADTLASEVGVLARGARGILPPFRVMPIGANGAVSWLGQTAAAVGAGAIAAAAVPLLGLAWPLAGFAALGGFLGCQVDSILGATLEGDATRPGPLGKQHVNFLGGLAPVLVVLCVGLLR